MPWLSISNGGLALAGGADELVGAVLPVVDILVINGLLGTCAISWGNSGSRVCGGSVVSYLWTSAICCRSSGSIDGSRHVVEAIDRIRRRIRKKQWGIKLN